MGFSRRWKRRERDAERQGISHAQAKQLHSRIAVASEGASECYSGRGKGDQRELTMTRNGWLLALAAVFFTSLFFMTREMFGPATRVVYVPQPAPPAPVFRPAPARPTPAPAPAPTPALPPVKVIPEIQPPPVITSPKLSPPIQPQAKLIG